MNFSTFIFDLDGTLIDSMPIWIEKILCILRKEKIACTEELIKTLTPLGDLGAAQYLKNELKVNLSIEEMLSIMDEYALPKYKNDISLKPGVLKLLTFLKNKGHSLSILTASPHKMVDPCLKRNKIEKLFDNIWSSDDFGKAKSDPDIYIDVLARLGASAEHTVLFDDNINAIKAAKEAGVHTIGVYDKSAEAFRHEMEETADMYTDSFIDLLYRAY